MRDQEIQDLLLQLKTTPGVLAAAVGGLSAEALVLRPESGNFSVLENICHLRDIEVEGYTVRIQRILSEEVPDLADIDGRKLAVERDYNKEDLSAAFNAFTDARRRNLDVLFGLSAKQFARTGELQGVGKVTLTRLLEMMCDHDAGHVDELRIARRRLLMAQES